MTWTEWQAIEEQSAHRASAVYELRIVTDHQLPVPMPRFLGTDATGRLCIGKTTDMESRRRQFVRALATCSGHSEGNLLHYLLKYSRLKARFPVHQFQYRYRVEADGAAATAAETSLIKAYVCEFGEVPPLNSAIPDRYGKWDA